MKVEFACPFCGRQAIADMKFKLKPKGKPMIKGAGIMHALPMCDQFNRLDPHEYLVAVNAALRGAN